MTNQNDLIVSKQIECNKLKDLKCINVWKIDICFHNLTEYI